MKTLTPIARTEDWATWALMDGGGQSYWVGYTIRSKVWDIWKVDYCVPSGEDKGELIYQGEDVSRIRGAMLRCGVSKLVLEIIAVEQ